MGLLDRVAGWLQAAEDEAPDDERALHLACAVLLFEVARADHDFDEAEFARLRELLRTRWNLEPAALEELLEQARRESAEGVSLHTWLDTLNRRLSREQKYRLLYDLWSVAWADGHIHHYEEHLIRRLADLLYVPHSQFIRARHEAGET